MRTGRGTRDPKPPTREAWDKATPWEQGYCAYIYGAWPNSEIPDQNPYPVSTREHELFKNGQHAAVLDVQDGEE